MTVPSASSEALYFDNAAGRIHYDSAGFVHLSWHRTPSNDTQVKALYQAAADALRHFGVKRILSDHRHMPPLSPVVQRWLVDVWTPTTIEQTGYRRGAVVQAFNVFNRLATNQVAAQIAHVLEVRHFDNEHDAAQWLQEAD